MKKAKKITLDKLRIIAAILIVAIHTYPFVSINKELDFIFTHVFCRIGVPLFLMITGYYVLPKAVEDKNKLIKYTIKILKIYLICIILYLPVDIYNGSIKEAGAINIIKDIFINGTFYHLWYFPALILGIWLTYFIVKKFKSNKTIIIFLILYAIGLLGDSYYGITERFEFTQKIYNVIFNVFNYTRNGLFYVPIFLYLGYKIKEWKISKKQSTIILGISIILMIIEGIILHKLNLQKHDSMYIMLIPTMISLFNLIILNSGENNKKLRNIATIIYIIHPMFIIVVRGIAKVLHLENVMIDNSIIHYLLVVILSVTFAIGFEMAKKLIQERNRTRNGEKQ